MKFNDKIYDILKWMVLVAIPACASAYMGFCTIFGWPYGDEVVKASSVVCALLGTLLGISNLNYKLDQQEGDEHEERN